MVSCEVVPDASDFVADVIPFVPEEARNSGECVANNLNRVADGKDLRA